MKLRITMVSEEGLEKVMYWKFKSMQEFYVWAARHCVGMKGVSYRVLN